MPAAWKPKSAQGSAKAYNLRRSHRGHQLGQVIIHQAAGSRPGRHSPTHHTHRK
jgi:hypothetical protein